MRQISYGVMNMFPGKIAALLVVLCAATWARAGEGEAFDFSKDNSLKAVFDSGFRPYRVLGLESVMLQLDDTIAGVVLPGGATLKSRLWKNIKFSIVKPLMVSTVQFRSNPMSLNDAQAAALDFAEDKEKELPRLDKFLAEVNADPLFHKAEYGLTTGENPRRSISLSRAGVPGKPLILVLYLTWERPKGPTQFYSDPIPPPPGYEHISMDDRRYPDLAGKYPAVEKEEPIPPAGQSGTFDFSADHSVKAVFDSGFRPYRMPGLESTALSLDNTLASVALPGSVTVKSRHWKSIDLYVEPPLVLTDMVFRSYPISLDDARAAALDFAEDKEKELPKLNEFLTLVGAAPLSRKGQFKLSTGENPQRSISFLRTAIPGKPLIFELTLKWGETKGRKKIAKGPLPAPPGYEHSRWMLPTSRTRLRG